MNESKYAITNNIIIQVLSLQYFILENELKITLFHYLLLHIKILKIDEIKLSLECKAMPLC